MVGGGTEPFPDLGEHCQNPDCKLLDFLPFTCDSCKLVFCLEHRSYKSHNFPKSDHGSRTVSICENVLQQLKQLVLMKKESNLCVNQSIKLSFRLRI